MIVRDAAEDLILKNGKNHKATLLDTRLESQHSLNCHKNNSLNTKFPSSGPFSFIVIFMRIAHFAVWGMRHHLSIILEKMILLTILFVVKYFNKRYMSRIKYCQLGSYALFLIVWNQYLVTAFECSLSKPGSFILSICWWWAFVLVPGGFLLSTWFLFVFWWQKVAQLWRQWRQGNYHRQRRNLAEILFHPCVHEQCNRLHYILV